MKTINTFNHLYIAIPVFTATDVNINYPITFDNSVLVNFLLTINTTLIQAIKRDNFNIKTIYISNNNYDLPLLFWQQLFIDLKPIMSNVQECSLECNFYDSMVTLQLLKQLGVNRLVWKVITFQDDLLLSTTSFNYQQKMMLIKKAIALGFSNFSLDLKYNLTTQTVNQITNDLQICCQLKAPHLSYDSDNDEINIIFKNHINLFLQQHAYQHYEYYSYVRNYHYQSLYIRAYCLLENYYGLGPNAVSYLGSNNKAILTTNSNKWPYRPLSITYLNQAQVFTKQLIQGLLLKQGIPITIINQHQIKNSIIVTKLIKNKQLIIKNKHLFCTNNSWILLNDLIVAIINHNTI